MDQPLAERMLRALLVQMLRSDAIDPDDVVAAADMLDQGGDHEAGHAMRCLIVESMAPSTSDWQAERQRARFRVVEGDDGNQS